MRRIAMFGSLLLAGFARNASNSTLAAGIGIAPYPINLYIRHLYCDPQATIYTCEEFHLILSMHLTAFFNPAMVIFRPNIPGLSCYRCLIVYKYTYFKKRWKAKLPWLHPSTLYLTSFLPGSRQLSQRMLNMEPRFRMRMSPSSQGCWTMTESSRKLSTALSRLPLS